MTSKQAEPNRLSSNTLWANSLPAYSRPHDRLCLAISILQTHHLANDTNLLPEEVFGDVFFMPNACVEHAIHLLISVLEDVELAEREVQS